MSVSVTHEALVQLFEDRPELAAELLRDAFQIQVPAFTAVRDASADLTQVTPAEYRADRVLLLHAGSEPVLGIVLEVQLSRDDRKRSSWPVYAADLRARKGCEACVLVVTPAEDVARWAAEPIVIGPPRNTFEVLVAGPRRVPEVRDGTMAQREPELGVLSAVAHGHDADPQKAAEIALAALEGCLRLDDERGTFYADVIRGALSEAARTVLEALMQSPGRREFQSEFVRKHYSLGEAEGEARGKAESVLAVLEARVLNVSAEERARILASKNIAELDRWLHRAVTVKSVDELFSH